MANLWRPLKYCLVVVLVVAVGSTASWYLSAYAALVLYGVVMTGAYLAERKKGKVSGRIAGEQRDDVYRLASHDLRAAVRQQRIAVEILNDNPSPERFQKAVEWIRGASDRTVAILDTIKEWTEVQRAPRNGSIELRDPLDQAMSALAADIERSGADISIGELPTVRANKNLVTSVFQNLLDNSIKYRRQDTPLQIRIFGKSQGPMVSVQVRDNGRGFSDLEGAFRMFRRLHTDVGDGTGKGLFLVREAVERLEGLVVADSTPGVGTTITFTLPQG